MVRHQSFGIQRLGRGSKTVERSEKHENGFDNYYSTTIVLEVEKKKPICVLITVVVALSGYQSHAHHNAMNSMPILSQCSLCRLNCAEGCFVAHQMTVLL